jgi:hypothetical protein
MAPATLAKQPPLKTVEQNAITPTVTPSLRKPDSASALSTAERALKGSAAMVPAASSTPTPVVDAPNMPLATIDTLRIAPPVTAAAKGAQRAGRHSWLRVNGDSATDLIPSTTALQTEAREVLGHLNKTKRLYEMKQPARAIPELRIAYQEFFVFAADHPNASETVQLRNQLLTVTNVVLADCPASQDSTSAPQGKHAMCAGLARAAALAGRPGNPAAGPTGRGRRQQPPPTS